MKIMMINGSPKVSNSNSEYFLKLVSDRLTEKEIIKHNIVKMQEYDEVVNDISQIDKIIIALPLYVDSIPSHVIKFLSYIEENYKKTSRKIKVYAIVNCGFYEGNQTHVCIKMLKIWTKKMGFEWGQGIGIGAGEMMGGLKDKPLKEGPNKNLGITIEELSQNINNNANGDEKYISPSYCPRAAFRVFANSFWDTRAKENGLKPKDLDNKVV